MLLVEARMLVLAALHHVELIACPCVGILWVYGLLSCCANMGCGAIKMSAFLKSR